MQGIHPMQKIIRVHGFYAFCLALLALRMGGCRSPYAIQIEYVLCSHGDPRDTQNPFESLDFLGIFYYWSNAWGGVDPPTQGRGVIAYDDDCP